VKYAFMREHLRQFSVSAMSRVLKVSRSGFYDWCSRTQSSRRQADAGLLSHIRQIHLAHRQSYGAIKTWLALNDAGIPCGKHRVARLRREAGILAKREARFRVTVEHHHTPQAAPDLLDRQFQAPAPDRVWVGDMTFIRTREGWLYLAILLDLFSRRVVGWSMGAKPDHALCLGALGMACEQRRPQAGLIHHTDRGATYSARGYRERMAEAGIRASMSGRKSAYDNAVAESFFSNLKNELIHHFSFRTRDEARSAIFDYIELFYNRKRIHQSLGYRTPAQVELEWQGA
jgi:transposase InsO family protein